MRLFILGVEWIPLADHRRPRVAATSSEMVCAILSGMSAKPALIHARSTVPAEMEWTLARRSNAPWELAEWAGVGAHTTALSLLGLLA
jgi:hypothetical protein